MTSHTYAIVIAAILTVLGQLLFKISSKSDGSIFGIIIINRYLILGCIIFSIVIFLTLYGLKKVPLIFMAGVYPTIQLTVVLIAHWLFSERLFFRQWLGIVILSAGIFVFYL